MLPKSVILKTEKHVLYWKNSSYAIKVIDAQIIADEILKTTISPDIKALLVDNRDAIGAWSAEVNVVWSDLMKNLVKDIDKCATIATALTSMQINRLSKEAGTEAIIRAFSKTEEALAFVGVTKLSVME